MYAPPPANVTRRFFRQTLHFLFPAPCLSCRRPLWNTREALGLCQECRRRLRRWPRACCPTCGRLQAARHVCGPCRRQPPAFRRLLCLWSYESPLDAVVVGLKFHRLDYLGAQLGRALAVHFASELVEEIEMVVPIPLSLGRWLGRGYNQASLIAKPLAAALGVPAVAALGRRWTLPQSRLGRAARWRNLQHALRLRWPNTCRDRRVLLVDDVVTTGATLRAAAACLERAGARTIIAMAVARTPAADEARGLTDTVGQAR